MPASIKGKLLLWLFVVYAGFLASAGYYLHYRLDMASLESVDQILHSKIQLISGLIEVDELHIEVELSEVVEGEYAIPRSGHYYRVLNWNDKEIVRSPSLVDYNVYPPVPTPFETDRYDTQDTGPAGEQVRWLTHSFDVEGGRYLTVQAGERLTEAYGLVRSFTRVLWLMAPLSLILLVAGAVVIVGWSLSPLKALSERVGLITHNNLSDRIPLPGQDSELRDLAHTFNTTLDRLESAFEHEKRLVSDASHELKTPVAVIKTQCDVILRRERTPAEYKDALVLVNNAANRMARLVESLLTMARIDAAGPVMRLAPLPLDEVITAAAQIVGPLAESHHLVLTCGDLGNAIRVTGDRERLTEMMVILLDNAVKYNRPGGEVTVSVMTSGEWAVIRVTDTGMGIAPKDLGRVFDRFWRADPSRTKFGAGLGLSIAKGIVDAHHGRIEVQSREGEGSCFIVWLPITPAL